MRRFWWVGLLGILAACQVFRGTDTQATLQAQNVGFATEAVGLEQTAQIRRTEVELTADAALTQVAAEDNVNRLLLATVRAGEVPTPGIQVGSVSSQPSVAVTQEVASGGDTQTQFVDIATASKVRPSDDCADGTQTQFASNSQRIYVTARALNIKQGTQMTVEWDFNGTKVANDSYTIPRDDNDFCFWFYLDSSQITFSAGQWSVRLFANGNPIGAPVTFTIVEAGTNG